MNELKFKGINYSFLFYFSICLTLIHIILSKIFYIILNFYNLNLNKNTDMFENETEEFILVVFFAPITETLFFQSIPSYLLRKYKIIYTILISSILFGVSHFNSKLHIFYFTIIGLIYILGYIQSIK